MSDSWFIIVIHFPRACIHHIQWTKALISYLMILATCSSVKSIGVRWGWRKLVSGLFVCLFNTFNSMFYSHNFFWVCSSILLIYELQSAKIKCQVAAVLSLLSILPFSFQKTAAWPQNRGEKWDARGICYSSPSCIDVPSNDTHCEVSCLKGWQMMLNEGWQQEVWRWSLEVLLQTEWFPQNRGK